MSSEKENKPKKSPVVQTTTTSSKKTMGVEAGTNCNLFAEYTEADEKLFSRADLTEKQLEMKENDPSTFWKSVNENLRSNLQDALADNEEAHTLRGLIKNDQKDLMKECSRLEKLAKEAQEIVNQYNQMI